MGRGLRPVRSASRTASARACTTAPGVCQQSVRLAALAPPGSERRQQRIQFRQAGALGATLPAAYGDAADAGGNRRFVLGQPPRPAEAAQQVW